MRSIGTTHRWQAGRRGARAAAVAVIGALLFAFGIAPAGAQDDDLPSRVGRLADVGGEVFHAPEDRASDWASVGLNFPVTNGDNLWVAQGGRAEIDFGAGQVRLADETNVHVSRLDDRALALFVAQGRVIVRLRVLDAGEVARIDTPNTQVVLTRPGLYRVDASPDRQRTVLVVREGEAMLPSQGGMQQVLPGQTATADGFDTTVVQVRNGVATDGFDAWSADRDRRYARASRYVSSQMIGAADLADYGTWEGETSYGAVWFPRVAAGWAPFRDGYWTWMTPWGWTWVDAAPWGFAPSHYGRWVFVGGRWGWCPGAYVARPFWSPAMVGWVGGAGWGLSLSFGAPVYGWVPLAWGEPFRPWWSNCSYRCWTHYNRPYAVRTDEQVWRNPPPRYRNVDHPGGITAVPGAAFTGSRSVSRNIVPVNSSQIAAMPMLASAPGVERPGAGHIPLVKPGTANTPRPASVYVPPGRNGFTTSKPLETGGAAQRAVTPSAQVPASTQRPVTSVPGAGKPGSAGAGGAPVARESYVAPPSGATPGGMPPAASTPGAKPAPSTSTPALRSGPPAYHAPVQRETLQTYPQGSQRAPSASTERRVAPPPTSAPGAAPAPVARSVPQAAPQVQHAPAPPPSARPVAPPPSSSGGNGKPHGGDGGKGGSQDHAGGGRPGGGQAQGGGDKPGQGR
ncbi:MAG: DUF6600 domain-containing protein [Burkholderiales bacterium]